MAPAASILLPNSAAAAASKRPADSDAELPLDSTSVSVLQQQGDEASRRSQQQQQQLECPRCQSTNTKFCYYNNYSMAQPRHFCRACRRYWTHGGTLRDVPVGGASRRSSGGGKRRRVSDEHSSATSSPLEAALRAEVEVEVEAEACLLPDLLSSFPFLSDGSFLPQFDLGGGGGGVASAAFSSWQSSVASVVPDFYDGLAPWDDGTTVGANIGFTSTWGDIAGLDLSWTPPGN